MCAHGVRVCVCVCAHGVRVCVCVCTWCLSVCALIFFQLKGGARSVQRTIRNNFMDSNKQEAIDMLLLGNVYSGSLGQKTRALLDQSDAFSEYTPSHFTHPHTLHTLTGPVPFRSGMCERWSDFTSAEKLRVAIGTWNVNGGKLINSIALRGSQSLDDWLLDGPKISGVTAKYVSRTESYIELSNDWFIITHSIKTLTLHSNRTLV